MSSYEFAPHRLSQIVYWLSISLLAVFASAAESRGVDPDLQILHDRLSQMSMQGDIDAKAVRGCMESQQPDGSWADINYEDPALTFWQPQTHVVRLLDMARAYRRADSPLHGDEKLKSSVFAAFDYWMKKDPRGRNWFHNQIGVPRQMLQVLFVLEPELSPERMKAGLKILKRASIRGTGQNLVWLAEITAARACLIGDAELCAKAFKAISDEIRITTKEGIQPDMSFHQHGAQLYNGGYGMGFANDSAQFARMLRGTRFAFPQEKIDILSRYILDGQQWMFRGIHMDYSVHGRAITRTDVSASGMIAGCEDMAKLDTPDRAKFLAFARTLKGEDEPGAALTGNKHFWRSDYMMHRRPGYNASVRVASKRVKRTEVVNGENLKGDHLSDGLTYIYRRGDEYTNIFPLWDWRKLPGTTCLQGDRPFSPGGAGKKTFAGGVSDGTYGCAAFDFENDGVTAKKAWFYFDKEFVCLGAGITCAAENAVVTSVNQCLLKGDVTARDAGGTMTIAKGSRALDGARGCITMAWDTFSAAIRRFFWKTRRGRGHGRASANSRNPMRSRATFSACGSTMASSPRRKTMSTLLFRELPSAKWIDTSSNRPSKSSATRRKCRPFGIENSASRRLHFIGRDGCRRPHEHCQRYALPAHGARNGRYAAAGSLESREPAARRDPRTGPQTRWRRLPVGREERRYPPSPYPPRRRHGRQQHRTQFDEGS